MRLPVIIINDCWEYIIELELEDMPVILWAIAGVFTMILIHGLVGYAQYRIWLQPILYAFCMISPFPFQNEVRFND